MKQIINKILSWIFPFKECKNRNSVFIQQSWLEKNTGSLYIKDILWYSKKC